MTRAVCLFFYCLVFGLRCYGQNEQPVAALPQAAPAAVGINADSVKALVQLIRTNPPNDFRGLVVIKDGQLVVEEYFNTYWRETIHDIRSAGKSVTCLLMGIAIDNGLVKSAEQSMYDFFPDKKFTTTANGARPDIKIKHLLNMSSGLSADDDDDNSPGSTSNWLTESDWVGFALALPMAFEPGEKFVYTDVCPMLIGAIIEKTSGQKLADFAQEHLFSPLGIREFYWYTAANGSTGPMGNLYISTLDFAKIGQLVANNGTWQNKQLVSPAWISQLGKPVFALSNPFSDGYGYLWYSASRKVNNKRYDYIFASGNGGNVLFIVPSENLVVAITSSAYGQGYGHFRTHNVFKSVLRALGE